MTLWHAEGGCKGWWEWLWFVSDNGRLWSRRQIRPIWPCETGAGRGSSASGLTWWEIEEAGFGIRAALCYAMEDEDSFQSWR